MKSGSSWLSLGLVAGSLLSSGVVRAEDAPWFDEEPASPERPATPKADAPAPGTPKSDAPAPDTDSAPVPKPSPAPESAEPSPGGASVDAPPASRHHARRSAARASSASRSGAETESSPPTLFGHDGKLAFGGYGGVTVLGSRIDGTYGALVGGEAAFLLDHRLAIGFGGMGLASDVEGPRAADGTRSRLELGYGGVLLEVNLLGSSPVYVSLGGLVGAGGVVFCGYGVNRWEVDCNKDNLDQNAFFVAEPRIGLRANVTRWMRFGLDARYRFTEGVDTRGLHDSDFSGVSFGGSIQFGWF